MSARVEGADRLQAKFNAMREAALRVHREEVKAGLVNIEGGARRRVRVDRGGLRNSITHEVAPDGLSGAAGTNSEYGRATEFGRRPGIMPPVEPLIDWARRHGIEDPESAGWAIAIKIRDEGIDAAPFLFPAFEEERPRFLRRLERRTREAIQKVARE